MKLGESQKKKFWAHIVKLKISLSAYHIFINLEMKSSLLTRKIRNGIRGSNQHTI